MLRGVAVSWFAALGIAMLATMGPVPARTEPAGQREARTLATLFADTCYDHAGELAALRTALGKPPFRSMPPDRAKPLLRRPGLAFEVPADPGRPVLLSFDDGWCGAGAGAVDPHALTLALSDAVRARGGGMDLMDAGGDGSEQHYMLHRSGNAAPIVLLVLLRGEQATLFSAAMPGTDAAPPGTARSGGRNGSGGS